MKSINRIVLMVVSTLFVLAGCSKKAGPAGPPPAPVLVAKAAQKTVPVRVYAIGNVEAFNMVTIKSQVNGPVMDVHFREGQDVKKGDLLFTIDPRPYEAMLKAAEANALKAKNSLERSRHLFEEHTISQQEFDDAVAGQQEAEAVLERTRLDVQYCSMRSPIDGRTGDVMVDIGNLVKANDDPALLTINQIEPIYANFALPEKHLGDVRKFMAAGVLKVTATVPSDPQPEDGVVSFVDNAVDKTTGTIRVKATFENNARRLWPGQFVDVVLTLTEEPNVTVVPATALQTGQSGQYVFVVKDDKTAEKRDVVVGQSVDGGTVIEKGVQPGETVIVDGQLRVVPGGKVEIMSGLQTK